MFTGIRDHHRRGRGLRLLSAGCAALLTVGALAACGPDEPDETTPADPPSVEESADPTEQPDEEGGKAGSGGEESEDGGANDGDSDSEGADEGDSGGRTGADTWRAPLDEVGHEWGNGWVALPASVEDIESILGETAPEIREGTEKVDLVVDCADGIDGTSLETSCTVTAEDATLDLPEVTWRVIGTAERDGADLTVRNEG